MSKVFAHCLIHSFLIAAIWKRKQFDEDIAFKESSSKKKGDEVCVHLGIGVAHHGNEKVQKEEEDDHDKETPVDLAFRLNSNFYHISIYSF